MFVWSADADVALNAIAPVQPNGLYHVGANWAPFATGSASVDFEKGLDIFVGQSAIGKGVREHDLSRRIDIGPFDFSGASDTGPFNVNQPLVDNSLARVSAGSTVVFLVSVVMTVWADGNASAWLDFTT